jgi:plasmid stabilization system protein ParE
MPRGDKSAYSNKQKRQVEHIEEGYERRGVPKKEAERRAWATENKISGGGRKSGSGRGRSIENKEPYQRGGRIGGRAAASRPASERRASARKAARTRSRSRG